MSRALCVLSLSMVTILVTGLGCGKDTHDRGQESTDDASSVPDQQSPNARFFPEPLEGELRAQQEFGGDDAPELRPVAVREKARPFPMHHEISVDSLERGVSVGFEMQFQFVWADTKRTVQIGAAEEVVWPRLRVQLLREAPSRPARMRWITEGVGFPFPEGTEIRARADRIGHVVVWPDQRSYRLAPLGSLYALLADRRVDRVPFVEFDKIELAQGTRLGKPTTRRTVVSSLGRASLETVEAPDLPYAAELLCYALLEITRIKGSPEICPEGALPVHFEVVWSSEHRFTMMALSWGAVGSLNLDLFRVPPDLPIFKRGELPPFEEFFFAREKRLELFPLSDKIGTPLPAVPAANPVPPGPEAPTAPPPPPRNQVHIKNNLHRPVVVMLNKVPFKWLAARTEVFVYLTSPDVRASARDFLGEKIFAERVLTAPTSWELGDEIEVASPPDVPQPPQ